MWRRLHIEISTLHYRNIFNSETTCHVMEARTNANAEKSFIKERQASLEG